MTLRRLLTVIPVDQLFWGAVEEGNRGMVEAIIQDALEEPSYSATEAGENDSAMATRFPGWLIVGFAWKDMTTAGWIQLAKDGQTKELPVFVNMLGRTVEIDFD